MFDGLFSFLKNVFVFAIIVIVIAVALFVVWLVYDSKKTAEHNRKVAEKKCKDEEFFARRKKYYLEGLPAIYDKWSTADLKVIYGYLETMHYNDRDDDDEHYNVGMLNRWGDAREKLLAHLGYPKWKWLNCEGYGYTDSPILATEDMNYVYRLIQSRK